MVRDKLPLTEATDFASELLKKKVLEYFKLASQLTSLTTAINLFSLYSAILSPFFFFSSADKTANDDGQANKTQKSVKKEMVKRKSTIKKAKKVFSRFELLIAQIARNSNHTTKKCHSQTIKRL